MQSDGALSPPLLYISYAEADSVWAEWVSWQLESAGHQVEFDRWSWAAGDNPVLRLDQALRRGWVVALLSKVPVLQIARK